MSTITYEEKDITIPTTRGEEQISVMVASNGLAYHLIPRRDGEGPGYSITHLATGRMMNTKDGSVTFDTHIECCKFIERIDPLFDWTKGEELRSLPMTERVALTDKLEAIRDEIIEMALF